MAEQQAAQKKPKPTGVPAPSNSDIPFAALRSSDATGPCRRFDRRIGIRPKASGCDVRFSPGAALAALRLRAGQQAQGQGPRRRRRHRRSRHGQSGSARAQARHRQARRNGRQAAHRSLFRLEGHRRPAPRAGRLLRAPVRGEARSRDAGGRDARVEGRLRQHGAGDHRAGRCRVGARTPPIRSTPSAS